MTVVALPPVADGSSRYAAGAPFARPVYFRIDWPNVSEGLSTRDVLAHHLERALRASGEWGKWREIYCGADEA